MPRLCGKSVLAASLLQMRRNTVGDEIACDGDADASDGRELRTPIPVVSVPRENEYHDRENRRGKENIGQHRGSTGVLRNDVH
jgi:hypothetical protein